MVSILFAGIARAGSPDTATVLRNLHEASQRQIAAGKIAKEQGQTVEVQTFGGALVADHRTFEKRIVALAAEMLLECQKILAEAKAARDETSDDRLKFLLEVSMPVLDNHHQRARGLVDTFGPSAIGAEAAKHAAAKPRD